jgi:hypothetical protein
MAPMLLDSRGAGASNIRERKPPSFDSEISGREFRANQLCEAYADDGAFSVSYTSDWLDPESEDWELPINSLKNRAKKGVIIIVPTLKKDIAKLFGNAAFINGLKTAISEHFGYLIQKGFSIWVNGEKIRAQTLQLYFTELSKKNGIRPYDFEADDDGVHVRVSVGFFRPLVRMEEIDEAAEKPEAEHARHIRHMQRSARSSER